MIRNKYILLFIFSILLSCSKDDDVLLSNSIDIFQPNNTFSFVNKNERVNSKLQDLKNLKEILNSKTHNLNNSLIKYPLKKI